MKRLSNLSWTPAWTSVVGCLHGCLKYLNIDPGINWLFGGTGHAFLINMSQDGSCPSGPTAWNTSRFYYLGRNLGYSIEGIFANNSQPDWKDKQHDAWELTKSALEKDLPVVGWELAIPEFYVVDGYDEIGYYYNGPGAEGGPNPKPWNELGDSGIGMLELYSVKPGQSANTEKIVLDALNFAIAFNESSSEWVLPEYQVGLDAYQVWIDAVKSGDAVLMGHAYNAAVWEECRRNGVSFLKDTQKRLNGAANQSFDGAIRSYGVVANQLKEVTEMYPFFENNREEPLGKNSRSKKAAEHLLAAQESEEEALSFLKDIVAELTP